MRKTSRLKPGRAVALWVIAAIGLSLWLTACQKALVRPDPDHATQVVQVQRVINAQALDVVSAQATPGLTERVQLIGLDAPDLEQRPWGLQAQRFLDDLIGPKSVRSQSQPVLLEFDVQPQDRFGRKLAYIWVGELLVNEKLVAEGYALAVLRPPNLKYEERLRRAQERARLLGLGIWNPDQPMRISPSEFRRQYQ
ncbi:thermonuclease family protein [Leptolyngbya sp. FACHB-261]|uniref:thermonuclease family protein n=1 Tax=Leptolyngbya sp. FACHB-261 TaxID=2692806 RepID=UPI0018EFAB9C|nr:thermonuclease family protein [Leptolyngbya sp. FACHB-261]